MAKYKVGNWAKIRNPPVGQGHEELVLILESMTLLCEAGIEQVTYSVRLWCKGKTGQYGFIGKELTMREMELGDIVKGEQNECIYESKQRSV